MKVAYLTGPTLAVSSIRIMLMEQFGRSNVVEIRSSILSAIDLTQYDMLVLPGSTGETSPYPDILGELELANIFEAVEENGLVLWTDCSATYYMLNDIEYISSMGLKKTRLGLGRVDGKARGPVRGKGLVPSENSRFAEVIARPVSYTVAGKAGTAEICYGNGPGLYLSDEERANPAVNILATYADAPENPVAALTKKMGMGLLVNFGVLIQIAPEHLNGYFSNPEAEEHRRHLFNRLSYSDEGRREFLSLVFRTIRNHCKSLKKSGAAPLTHGVENVTFP
jgi:glutamine amidotransferase-like uncharacterized protein